MLHSEGAGVAGAADGRGHVCWQNQVRVVAGDSDARAGGGVVGKRGVGRVGIGDGEVDGRLGGGGVFHQIGLVRQRSDNTGIVVDRLHQHADGGAAGAQYDAVGIGARDGGDEGFQRRAADLHAGAGGVDETGVGRVGQRCQGGVEVGLAAGERQRLGAAAGEAGEAGDSGDIQRAVERGEGVGDGWGAVTRNTHLFKREIIKVIGLGLGEGDGAGVEQPRGGLHRPDVGSVGDGWTVLRQIIDTIP